MDRWNKAVDQTLAARDKNGGRAVSPKSGFPVRPQKFPASAEEIPRSPARAPFLTAFDVGKISVEWAYALGKGKAVVPVKLGEGNIHADWSQFTRMTDLPPGMRYGAFAVVSVGP
jgi:hypothetical protein